MCIIKVLGDRITIYDYAEVSFSCRTPHPRDEGLEGGKGWACAGVGGRRAGVSGVNGRFAAITIGASQAVMDGVGITKVEATGVGCIYDLLLRPVVT